MVFVYTVSERTFSFVMITNVFSVGISDEVKGSVIELDEKQWQ